MTGKSEVSFPVADNGASGTNVLARMLWTSERTYQSICEALFVAQSGQRIHT